MISTPWRYLLIAVLLVLLGALVWRTPPETLKSLITDKPDPRRQYPIAYMNDVKTTQFDEQGHINYQLKATLFVHFEGEGRTTKERETNSFSELTKPFITLYNQDVLPWQASADEGISEKNGDQITLLGNVVLWQQSEQGIVSRVTTNKLVIQPKQQYAQTDKPVMISDPTGTTNAIGAKVFLPINKIELLSTVRGIYDAH